MNQLQQELAAEPTMLSVEIVGVNQDGFLADYNAIGGFCDGRNLPFLEEGPDDGVWAAWGVSYRDVVVLDADNQVVTVYNLTEHSLQDPANYEALKEVLLAAANPTR